MSAFKSLLVVSTIIFGSVIDAQAEDKSKANVDWTKRIATDFLDAAIGDNPLTGVGLLTPECARGLEAEKYQLLKRLQWGYKTYELSVTEISPDGGEVVFRGTVLAKPGFSCEDADFVLRVVRENNDKKWAIRFISVKERNSKNAK